jgi:hypothetical protein
MQYPGGEKKFQAFQDNLELIRLDRKFQAGDEPFTEEELDFVFQISRPIERINPFNQDNRIAEMQDIDRLLDIGTDADALIDILNRHIDLFRTLAKDDEEFKDNIDKSVEKARTLLFAKHIDKFLAAGADADRLVESLNSHDIADNLDKLLAASVDVDKVAKLLSPYEAANSLDKLLAAGATISIDGLVESLKPNELSRNVDKFLAAGVDADRLVESLIL